LLRSKGRTTPLETVGKEDADHVDAKKARGRTRQDFIRMRPQNSMITDTHACVSL
jgi:hypothetical protein